MLLKYAKRCLFLLAGVAVMLSGANLRANGFITEWLVLGPYPNYQTENYAARGGQGYFYDYLKKFGGETGILPDPAQKENVEFIADWSKLIAGIGSTNEWGEKETKTYTVHWKTIKARTDSRDGVIISFNKLYPVDDYLVVYAFCAIQSPDDRQVQFRIGSDDDHKVWLNGQYAGGANSSQGVIKDNFIYNV